MNPLLSVQKKFTKFGGTIRVYRSIKMKYNGVNCGRTGDSVFLPGYGRREAEFTVWN